MFLEAQVRRATERPADNEWAFSTKGAQQVWKKKYQGQVAIASRREAGTHFVTEVEEQARQFETRSLTWWLATRGTASKNE